MPKGRGANTRRRNHNLAGRHGGGTQSGLRHAQALTMASATAEWRSRFDVWRLTPRAGQASGRRGWWARLVEWVTRLRTPPTAHAPMSGRDAPAQVPTGRSLQRVRSDTNPGEHLIKRRRA